MNQNIICYVLGRLVLAEAVILGIPFFMALYGWEKSAPAFAVSICICVLIGLALRVHGRSGNEHLTMREGAAITGLGWLLATFLGMLPYLLSGSLGFLDGLFESISGFTGTGATVMTSIESQPFSILFWRMMTHWFGGLGIIVIFIALLPQAGQSTVYMYNAETTGPTRDRVLPRLREMTRSLFLMYMVFTMTACVIYLCCGLSFLDAIAHAMSTLGTGGFSLYDDNAMHFDNPALEGWMTFFMILAGGNFGLYYRVWKKGPRVLRNNTEFQAYLVILAAAMLLITVNLVDAMGMQPVEAFRYASFQVGSLSTTGFVSADFDQWPAFSKGVLMMLMISGDILLRVGQFFFLYIFAIVFWALLLTFDGIGAFDALGISVTTLGNVGPAFGIAGATCTFAGLSDFSKSILCIEMLLGRLELFTLLVMLSPEFWKIRNRW